MSEKVLLNNFIDLLESLDMREAADSFREKFPGNFIILK